MRCRSCCLSCSSALCCAVRGGWPGLISTAATGTGASGTEVVGGPEGKTGVDCVCAWEAPAKQNARTDDPSRNDQRDTLTLVLDAGVVPSLVFSQGLFPASVFAERTSRMIGLSGLLGSSLRLSLPLNGPPALHQRGTLSMKRKGEIQKPPWFVRLYAPNSVNSY
jgi:hypothetical protein